MSARSHAPRLLVCTDTYPPQVNGVSVVTALSVQGLLRRGWEVALVHPRYPAGGRDPFAATAGDDTPGDALQLPSIPLPLYPDLRLSLPDPFAVALLADRFRPDLVHCTTEFALGWVGRRLARRRGLPLVTSYHTDFARYADAYALPWLRPAVERHLARFHRSATRTYTPSAAARRDLLALGVRDVVVWGRGVDVQLFHPRHRSEPLRAAYGGRDTFVFLHVGRLAAEKGVERLLAAYALASASVPKGAMHLVIAGAGPRGEALRQGAPESVTFLGTLDRVNVLPRLYASADAFLLASLTETLGLVILEAMASGLPVIAVPAGGVAEYLRDGVNGVATPPHDVEAMAAAMVALVHDRQRALTLAAGARETAEAAGWEAELDRLDANYRDVLATPVRSTPREVPLVASA